jgi:hypothetical protein
LRGAFGFADFFCDAGLTLAICSKDTVRTSRCAVSQKASELRSGNDAEVQLTKTERFEIRVSASFRTSLKWFGSASRGCQPENAAPNVERIVEIRGGL